MGRAAAFWQLLFVLRGTSRERVRAAAEDGLMLLRGFTPAQMQELVAGALEPVLGFDGALGTICEVQEGVYTGRGIRSLHGEQKASAVRELAEEEGFDLVASTAYSDSHTDLPFLEAVGRPIAVNPDRALWRIAAVRSWPVLRFSQRAG